MGFRMGIVGLPNVGKSTLFNALTKTAAAQAANFPFCTIEPNVGEVAVPDTRLDKLAEIAGSKQIIPTRITFVDIAGLVYRRIRPGIHGMQRKCQSAHLMVSEIEDQAIAFAKGAVLQS